jgi:hypothetical protein
MSESNRQKFFREARAAGEAAKAVNQLLGPDWGRPAYEPDEPPTYEPGKPPVVVVPAASQTAAEPPRKDAVAEFPSPAEYRTELMELQERAIKHFNITATHWPKQQDLYRFFLAHGLSRHLAKAMTTICRPSAAMKGGNRNSSAKG